MHEVTELVVLQYAYYARYYTCVDATTKNQLMMQYLRLHRKQPVPFTLLRPFIPPIAVKVSQEVDPADADYDDENCREWDGKYEE